MRSRNETPAVSSHGKGPRSRTTGDPARGAIRESESRVHPAEPSLDRLTRLAVRLIRAEAAVVSLVTDDGQVFASELGFSERSGGRRGTSLSRSFCESVVRSGMPLVVGDTRRTPATCDTPSIGGREVIAYAGVPLMLRDGRTVGSFCVMESRPREWSTRDLESLRDLATFATTEIEARIRAAEAAAARRATEAADRQFRATFEQAAVGIAHIGLNGEWLRVNKRLCEFLGYDKQELVRLSLRDISHAQDRAADARLLRRLMTGKLPWYKAERRYVHRSGHDVWFMMTVSLVCDDRHAPQYFIAVAEDISERRRTEDALRETERGLRQTQSEMLARLAQASELRDDDTGLHTRRVGALSAKIAVELKLTGDHVELILEAAPLHDVGKIGIPDTILMKPGPLTPDERALMERHAAHGARILAGSDAPLAALAESIAHGHHERWDGAGYPRRLAGQDIPLAARIVAVADVFDALSHDRCYRQAWPKRQAVDYVISGGGTLFDPAVVSAFQAVFERGQNESWLE